MARMNETKLWRAYQRSCAREHRAVAAFHDAQANTARALALGMDALTLPDTARHEALTNALRAKVRAEKAERKAGAAKVAAHKAMEAALAAWHKVATRKEA